MAENINKIVCNHKIVQFLDKGTFGKVYKALNLKTNEEVAIKMFAKSK